MLRSPYRKEWYVGTSIAKSFIGLDLGSRIPTISEYAGIFDCSRGIVQNALCFLEEQRAVRLDKQGKKGTFLAARDEKQLFHYSGLNHLTASMPPPINLHFAGLATGICNGMSHCEVPFTFAFVQGSENRAQALVRGAYDFVITTRSSAETFAEKYPELEVAVTFDGCEYSRPYKLYINRPGQAGLTDGMIMAVDPTSLDQLTISRRLCEGRDIQVVEMPLIRAVYAFYTGQIDCMVFRDGIETQHNNLMNIVLKNQESISPTQISEIPLTEASRDLQLPVALVHRTNYGMAGILQKYLTGEGVGFIQNQVISGNMVPQFY